VFAFLAAVMTSLREWQRYSRAVRHAKRTHMSLDLLIYAIKKVQSESSARQNVSVTFSTPDGGTIRIAVDDREQESRTLDHEERLYADHRKALRQRYGMGAAE